MRPRAVRFAYFFASLCLVFDIPPLHAQSLGPPGTNWGGEHIRLEVTENGATVEFDCASGSISKRLVTSANGNFKVQGTFTRERPGPVMRDNPNVTSAAMYSGTITGDTLHLHIDTGTEHDSLGDYVLVRSQPGRVVKCR